MDRREGGNSGLDCQKMGPISLKNSEFQIFLCGLDVNFREFSFFFEVVYFRSGQDRINIFSRVHTYIKETFKFIHSKAKKVHTIIFIVGACPEQIVPNCLNK